MPAFGKEQLNALDYSGLKGWVISQSAKYSKDAVRLMLAVLRTMLQEAVNEGILAVNPVAKLGKFYRSARKIKEKVDPFTIEELHLIESTCRKRFPEYYPFILCLTRTGIRIGEVTALQRIYSHWVPGTRRVSTTVPNTQSANVRQMEGPEKGKEEKEEAASR